MKFTLLLLFLIVLLSTIPGAITDFTDASDGFDDFTDASDGFDDFADASDASKTVTDLSDKLELAGDGYANRAGIVITNTAQSQWQVNGTGDPARIYIEGSINSSYLLRHWNDTGGLLSSQTLYPTSISGTPYITFIAEDWSYYTVDGSLIQVGIPDIRLVGNTVQITGDGYNRLATPGTIYGWNQSILLKDHFGRVYPLGTNDDATDGIMGKVGCITPHTGTAVHLHSGTTYASSSTTVLNAYLDSTDFTLTAASNYYQQLFYIDSDHNAAQDVVIESFTPDYIDHFKLEMYNGSSSAWQTVWNDDTYTAANLVHLNNTSSGLDFGIYRSGQRGDTVSVMGGNMSMSDVTLSAYYGCINRTAFKVTMNADDGSDSASTGASQVKVRLTCYYNPEGVVDNSDYTNHGTQSGGVTRVQDGVIGEAVEFDGENDYVDCFFDSSLSFTDSDEWGWSTWMNWSGSTENYVFFVGKNAGNKNLLLRQNNNNRFAFRDKNGAYHLFAENSSQPYINTLTYIEYVADGTGNLSLYINGTLFNTLTGVPTEIDFRYIGRGYNLIIYLFSGSMDEVRIYNRALNSTEIAEHYNHTFTNESGLVFHSPMELTPSGAATYEFENSADPYYGLGNLLTLQHVSDDSDYDNLGVAYGGVTANASGQIGEACDFDGTSGYLDCGNDASLSLDLLTAEMWVKKIEESEMPLISKGSTSSNQAQYYFAFKSSEVLGITFRGNLFSSTTVLNLDTWYHVVTVCDNSNDKLQIYINGSLDCETNTATTDSVNSVNEAVKIATRYYSTTHIYGNGSIDEVRIYNRALNATEISEHYNGTFTNETGLVFHSPMELSDPDTTLMLYKAGTQNVTYITNESGNAITGMKVRADENELIDRLFITYASTPSDISMIINQSAIDVDTDTDGDNVPDAFEDNVVALNQEAQGGKLKWDHVWFGAYNHPNGTGYIYYTMLDDGSALVGSELQTAGTQNMSLNTAGAGEEYNFTIHDGVGNWINVGSGLTTGTRYALQNTSGIVEAQAADANGSLNFTSDLVAGTYDISSTPISIELLSFEPETIYTNYTGKYNISYAVSHDTTGLNNSSLAFLFGLNYTIDNTYYHSIRPPSNNISASVAPASQFGNIFRQFQRNITPYLGFETNATMTEGNIWKWGGLDYNSTSLVVNPVNSTYTYVNVTGSHITAHQNMHYLDAMYMFASTKTQLPISKSQGLIIKVWDVDQMLGRSDEYFLRLYLSSADGGATPDSDIQIRILNSSFNPLTDDPTNSTYSTEVGTYTPAAWLNHAFTPHPNSSYPSPIVINVSALSIELDEVNYIYVHSGTVSSKPYYINVTNADSGTNKTFGEAGVAWTKALPGGAVSTYAYTPTIFTIATRDYEQIEIQLYGANNNGVWAHSGIANNTIGASQINPTAPTFQKFTFAGHNDTTMDCTYRDNITVWLTPGTDPDGGSVTNNLTLWRADKTTFAATINNTFVCTNGSVGVNFNTTPYYSTTTLYNIKCETEDDEGAKTSRWLYRNFSLSPLGTSGAFVDECRITFWGMDDVADLYTTLSDPTALSLSGGIYTFHTAVHHSQHGDVWNVTSNNRIVSINEPCTPYYRITGSDNIDGAKLVSWNETTAAPASVNDTYRTYIYSDENYSTMSIRDSNLSYLGIGVSPFRGVYIQNGEGMVMDNNTFMHNGYGVYVVNGGNFSITNNTVTDPAGTCLFLKNTKNNVSIRDNVLNSDVETSGFQTYKVGSDYEFINNTITGEVQSAFLIKDMTDSILRDNTINSVQYGIQLSRACENITVINNNVSTQMDVHGNPSYSISVYGNDGEHNISNNIVTSHDGWGISVHSTDNVTLINNSVIADNASYTDYVFYETTGIVVRNPVDSSNTIKVNDVNSSIIVENTDSQAFSENSSGSTYAYTNNNFTLSTAGVVETFTVTQHNVSMLPSTDKLLVWNLETDATVRFNVSSDTGANPTWFNLTNSTWVLKNINIYRNDTLYASEMADAAGKITYNYSDSYSEKFFEFTVDVIPPASITGLTNSTGKFWHNWTWTDPADADFNYTMVYINGVWTVNTTDEYYNLSASAHNSSTISTHTVDTTGNMNATWVNHTSVVQNNVPTLTGIPNLNTPEDTPLYDIIDLDDYYSDDDSDTPAFSVDSNNQSMHMTIHISGTSKVDFIPDSDWYGTAEIVFKADDGYGGTDTDTMIFTVNSVNDGPVLDPIGPKSVNENETLYINADATDTEGNPLTYSCSRTDLFTDFSTSTGEGNWTTGFADAGTYYVDFGVSDGALSDNETVTITVIEVPTLVITAFTPLDTTPRNNINDTRTFTVDVNQVCNVTWYINTVLQQTNTSVDNASYTPTGADGTWNVSAVALNANGTDMQTWTWIVDEQPSALLFPVYVLILIFAVCMTGYTFLVNDINNYTHIITGFTSSIIYFIAGYYAYIGIGFSWIYDTGSATSFEVVSYQYPWLGLLLVIMGVIMILYSIVQVIHANLAVIKDLEGEEVDYHTSPYSK